MLTEREEMIIADCVAIAIEAAIEAAEKVITEEREAMDRLVVFCNTSLWWF